MSATNQFANIDRREIRMKEDEKAKNSVRLSRDKELV